MFTLRLFSARVMTVTGKLRLRNGRLSQSTNRQFEFSTLSHQLRAKKAQWKRTLRYLPCNDDALPHYSDRCEILMASEAHKSEAAQKQLTAYINNQKHI